MTFHEETDFKHSRTVPLPATFSTPSLLNKPAPQQKHFPYGTSSHARAVDLKTDRSKISESLGVYGGPW